MLAFIDPGVKTTCTVAQISLSDWLFTRGAVPCLEGDATGKRAKNTVDYVMNADREILGRKGEVDQLDGTRVVRVTYLAIKKSRYYGLIGANKARYRGDEAYHELEAQLRAELETAAATGKREDRMAASYTTKRLRERGWHHRDVSEILQQLKDNSIRQAMAQGASATLRVAALRVHLLLDHGGAWWRFKRSTTSRRLAFERARARDRGIQDMLAQIAPRTADTETLIVCGSWDGRRAVRRETMASPVRRFKRHAARHRVLVTLEESNSTKKCPECASPHKDMEHKMGNVKRKLRTRRAILASRIKAFNQAANRDDSAYVPEETYRRFKREAKWKRVEIHSSSVCHNCVAANGERRKRKGRGRQAPDEPPQRVWSRDYASARTIARCYFHILTNDGQRPPDLRARRDLSQDRQQGSAAHAGAADAPAHAPQN